MRKRRFPPTQAGIRPPTNDGNVEAGYWPHYVHDLHVLGMGYFIERDHHGGEHAKNDG
jgi:hypothetical protein